MSVTLLMTNLSILSGQQPQFVNLSIYVRIGFEIFFEFVARQTDSSFLLLVCNAYLASSSFDSVCQSWKDLGRTRHVQICGRPLDLHVPMLVVFNASCGYLLSVRAI